MLARNLYSNSRYFSLFVLVIVAVGWASFNSIPRQEDPSITNFVATITTPFPGATPARVETLVTRPLEDELRKIAEIDWVRSTSSTGISFLNIKLEETLADEDLDRAWSEIRDAMDTATIHFPAGAGKPVFDDDRLKSYTTILALTSAPGREVPLSLLHRLAQDFADDARNISGVRKVDLYGEPDEEIRVQIDEQALASRGIGVSQVASALRAADPKISSGRAAGAGSDLLIEVAGDLDSMARIRNVIVGTADNGSSIRVSDVAQVFKTQTTPPRAMAITDGQAGILIGIIVDDGLQVDVWSDEFNAFSAQWAERAPAGVNLTTTYDQSVYTRERLRGVAENLAVGIALVILVLLGTLGWRAAIVVAVILPLCALSSLAILNYWGVALHQMSITGLVVALGLLVDGSIVMTDEIRKRLLRGRSPLEAITASVHRLRIPLLSSTATTILTFMPLVVLPGPSGDFMGSIAKSVVAMLGSSFVLAMTLTPVLAGWLLPSDLRERNHWWERGLDSGAAGKALERALDWALRHRSASIALALALPISGFISFPTLTAQFFPGTDRDQLYIQVKLPDGRSIYHTHELVGQLDSYLREQTLIRRIDWTLGESPPAFYYNMYRMKERIPSYAEALVLTHDENQTDDLIRRMQAEMDSRFPQARIIVRGIDQGPPVQAPLEVELFGPNLEVLRELGNQFRLRLERLPDITHTSTSLTGGAPKLVFNLDQERLRLAGLQLTDVAQALDANLRGATGGEVLEDTERLPVRVRLDEDDWATSDQISNLRVPLARAIADGEERLPAVALNNLGTTALVPTSSPIARKDGIRTNIIQAYLTRGVLPEEALKQLRADLKNNPIPLPQGYSFSFGGDSDVRADVVDQIMAPMGMIVAALVATIVLTFNSWRLSAIAGLVCLCSLGLSVLSLALFQYPFGVQALIGVIGSVGVSINAAIIIMTALQLDPGAMAGGLYAIRRVVMDSSRHIVSTTVTTFGGFLPLILEGSQFWPPFAMAVAGGVLLSTVVSFFLVPPLFSVVVTKRRARSLEAPIVNSQLSA